MLWLVNFDNREKIESTADMEYTNSRKQTESLTKPQIEQYRTYSINNDDIKENQNQIKNKNLQLYASSFQEIILNLLA